MALTDREVKLAKPRVGPYYLIDGRGLYLKVSKAGTKTWFYRRGRAWAKLGRYPSLTLLEARNKAADAAGRGFVMKTVEEAYSEYTPILRRVYASHNEIERRFRADILPYCKTRRVDEISRTEVSMLFQRIVDRGARVAANRTLPDVKNFFAWCVEKGWIDVSPASGITRRSVGGKEKPKSRALVAQELSLFVAELLKGGLHLTTRLALGLILLTGQRPSEVLGLTSWEIRGTWWHIPAERTKARRLQKVYLSPQARVLLKVAFRHLGSRPFGMDHRTLSKALGRLMPKTKALGRLIPKLPGVPPFTPQDLRRTMATRLADLGVAPHVIEKMLNHKLEGVMAVYNVAEYLPERREAWRLWGRYLAKLRREHAANSCSC